MDAADGLTQERCHGKDRNLGQLFVPRDRDGVSDYHLLHCRRFYPLNGRSGENRVSAAGIDLLCPLLL